MLMRALGKPAAAIFATAVLAFFKLVADHSYDTTL
jgi:hypothetical protein